VITAWRWFAGILSALVVAFVVWVATTTTQVGVNATQIDNLDHKIDRIDRNVDYIRDRVDQLYNLERRGK